VLITEPGAVRRTRRGVTVGFLLPPSCCRAGGSGSASTRACVAATLAGLFLGRERLAVWLAM
jgi:hypothetical protein